MREGYYQDQTINWLPRENSRGLVILGHGLNVHPFKMRPLASFFHELRFDVLIMALAGHRKDSPIENVTGQDWIDDAGETLKFAENIAQKKNYPYYFCGFSTSCLAIQRQLQLGQWSLKKQILLAPAIALRPSVRMSFPVMALPLQIKTKSFTPLNYRYNSHLSLKTYGALRRCYLDFYKNDRGRVDIPTLVYHRPTDELISEKGLRNLTNQMEHWTYDSIAPQQTGYWQHLIIDSPSMGSQDWAKFQQNVKNFLI